MKMKVLKLGVAAILVAGLGSATAALATPGHGNSSAVTITTVTTGTTSTTHGRPPTTGAGCRPQVSLIVKGTTTSAPGTSSLSLNVTGGNHFAKLLFAHNTSTSLTANVGSSTSITTASGASTTLASISSGSKVLIQYRVCKADIKSATTASALSSMVTGMTARKVVTLG